MMDIESLFWVAEHEICFDETKFAYIIKMKDHLQHMQDKLRFMAFICDNNKDNRILSKSLFLVVQDSLKKYDSIPYNISLTRYIYDNNKDGKIKFSKQDIEYYFIQKLNSCFWHLDQLRKNLHKVSNGL